MAPLPMEREERQYREGERIPGTEYVVIRLEAEGGHGALYLVKHHFLEKKIQMLKTLRAFDPSTELIERLKREAQMLAGMDHPHIVSVTSGGLTDEKQPRPYFVMERLKGRSLAQILPQAPEGVGVDAALKVTIEICDALEYVHTRHGVVHRDIKPDNVFLQVTPRNGSVTKLLDFGVAHIMDLERRYTKNNLFLGTPRYASPEQIMGDKPSPQTDLYAVGLVLYELLLGYGPFDEATNFASVASAHVQQPPPGFPKTRRFPEGLEELVMSLLRKDATQRPKSAEWLAVRLRQIKRIAEMAELHDGRDVNLTDLSPMQNALTGHRASLTEAGAPLDTPSDAALPEPEERTSIESPLGFRGTVRLPSAPPRPIDASKSPPFGISREAPTRTLHLAAESGRKSDTEALPGPPPPVAVAPSPPFIAPAPAPVGSGGPPGFAIPAMQAGTATSSSMETPMPVAAPARRGSVVLGASLGVGLVVLGAFVLHRNRAVDLPVAPAATPPVIGAADPVSPSVEPLPVAAPVAPAPTVPAPVTRAVPAASVAPAPPNAPHGAAPRPAAPVAPRPLTPPRAPLPAQKLPSSGL